MPSYLLEPLFSLSDSLVLSVTASQPIGYSSVCYIHSTGYIELSTWSLLPAGFTFNTVNISQFNTSSQAAHFLLYLFWLMML